MNNKILFAGTLSTVLAALLLGSPMVYAGDSSQSSKEQHPESVKAEIRDAWLDGKLEATLLFNEHLDSFAIDTKV
ncbi:MAG TPA: hypothetical protein VKN35_03575, partial [Xanthomonadales bacterium]|nr:hypothetical protein [Xanthomonadales bacterium]